MADQIFGELRYEDDYGWWGKHTLRSEERRVGKECL